LPRLTKRVKPLLKNTISGFATIANELDWITIRRRPRLLTLKKGVPIILQLSTEDRSHGFYAPSFNLRADIVPGKVTELKVTPQKIGDFDYFCDIYCGSGHENMMGKIKVVE